MQPSDFLGVFFLFPALLLSVLLVAGIHLFLMILWSAQFRLLQYKKYCNRPLLLVCACPLRSMELRMG